MVAFKNYKYMCISIFNMHTKEAIRSRGLLMIEGHAPPLAVCVQAVSESTAKIPYVRTIEHTVAIIFNSSLAA